MTDERAFLAAILQRPDDHVRKLVYADWLEDQGDPRAEYLRLMVKVRQERVLTPQQRLRHHEISTELAQLNTQVSWRVGSTPENRERQQRMEELERQLADLSKQMRQSIPARLQELAATLDTNWLAIVSDPEIERCAKPRGEGWRLRFVFLCDKSWADMKPTTDDKVRHCETCRENVYFCDNLADARSHSEGNHCIAVDLGILRREGDLQPPIQFLGQPTANDLWESYVEGMDPVSEARLDARTSGRNKRKRKW
jgi:uncharacterized protein (TIGR02996 family)